jgi:NAD(P)-dependent dehydrogenase (short-subunit alcohol dehydrogenase family)
VHLMQVPFYFSSKAAVMSFAKCLAPLRKNFGIRNSCITPGMSQADYCKERLLPNE